jgi:hypothetical protein
MKEIITTIEACLSGTGEVNCCVGNISFYSLRRMGSVICDFFKYVCMYMGGPKTGSSTATFNDLLCLFR